MKRFCCTEPHKDRQEVKARICCQIQQSIQIIRFTDPFKTGWANDCCDQHKEACCQNNPDHGQHALGECIDNLCNNIAALGFILQHIFVQIFFHNRFRCNIPRLAISLVDIIHFRSDNNLKLLSKPLGTDYTRKQIDFVRLDNALVFYCKSQSRHAMAKAYNVAFSSYISKNLVCQLRKILFCHFDHSQIIFIYCFIRRASDVKANIM